MNEPVRPPPPKDPDLFQDPGPANAVPGHNEPPIFDPEPLQHLTARVESFTAAGGEWLDLQEITDEDQASNLADFIAGLRGLKRDVEGWRVKTKEPFRTAAETVDKAAKVLELKADDALKKALGLSGAWQTKKQREAEVEAQRKRDAAAAAAAEAARLKADAEARNDISGSVEADLAAKQAEKDLRMADKITEGAGRVQSASGGARAIALVKVKTAKITNIRLAFMAVQDDPGVVDAIQRALNAKIRAKGFEGTIGGVEINVTEVPR